jgi:hypothetical protein
MARTALQQSPGGAHEVVLPRQLARLRVVEREQVRALQDTLTAIRLRLPVAQAGRALHPSGEHHLRPRETLERLYPRELLEETVRIASLCDFSLDELRYEYPEEIVPAGKTPAQHLRDLTEEGLRRRYAPSGSPEERGKRKEERLKAKAETGEKNEENGAPPCGTDSSLSSFLFPLSSSVVPERVRSLVERELSLIAELRYEPFFLTVPVPSDCKKMNIGEIPVKQGTWVEKHLKTIQQLYDWRNDDRLDTIQHLYQDAYSLGVFNMQTTRFLLQHFKIDTPCIKASLLGCDKRKSELVLQLCQGCRATRYLSGPLGRDYLDLTSFADAGIEVVFNDYVPQTANHKLSGLHLLKTVGEL